jgi:hypothetical protein
MSAKLKLVPHERQHPIWMKIEEELNRRIDVLRRMNDGAFDEIQTARLRGRIAELKDLLAMGKDAEVIEVE